MCQFECAKEKCFPNIYYRFNVTTKTSYDYLTVYARVYLYLKLTVIPSIIY